MNVNLLNVKGREGERVVGSESQPPCVLKGEKGREWWEVKVNLPEF